MPDMTVGLAIGKPGGGVLELNTDPAIYQLEASTREERTVSWRRQEVTSPFVEGSYQVTAVRENVMEKVAVWVRGADHAALERRVTALLEAVEQPRFQASWYYVDGLSHMVEEWACQCANYTVRTQREYQHANLALVRLEIPRLPRVTIRYSDGTVVTR